MRKDKQLNISELMEKIGLVKIGEKWLSKKDLIAIIKVVNGNRVPGYLMFKLEMLGLVRNHSLTEKGREIYHVVISKRIPNLELIS